jgi:hypothetical protein
MRWRRTVTCELPFADVTPASRRRCARAELSSTNKISGGFLAALPGREDGRACLGPPITYSARGFVVPAMTYGRHRSFSFTASLPVRRRSATQDGDDIDVVTFAEDVEEDAVVTHAAAESGLGVLEVHDVARKGCGFRKVCPGFSGNSVRFGGVIAV